MRLDVIHRIIELAKENREDAHTEVFAALLDVPLLRRTYVRNVLAADLDDDEVDALVVELQRGNEDARGVVDVLLQGRRAFLVIENKIRGGFSPNQPLEYVKEAAAWLRKNKGGVAAVYLQAPSSRREALARESWQRLSLTPDGHRSRQSVDGVRVEVISWEQTFAAFRDAQLEDAAAGYIRDSFIHGLSLDLVRVSRVFTKEHLMVLNDRVTLEAIWATEDLIHDLVDRLRRPPNKHIPSSLNWSKDRTFRGVGIYPDEKVEQEVWVGLSFRAGALLEHGPLWVQLVGEAFDEPGIERLRASGRYVAQPPPELEWVPRPIVHLPLRPGADAASQMEAVLTEIETILRMAASRKDERPVRRKAVRGQVGG